MAFKRSSNSAGGLQVAFDSGTPTQKAAFQSSVSGVYAASRLVIFGDSRAYDCNQGSMQSWTAVGPHVWAQAASSRWLPVVANTGITGNRSDQMLARIDADLFAHNPTDVLFICCHNDMQYGMTAAQSWENIKEIFDRCRARGIFVHHLGPYPAQSGTAPFDTATHWAEKQKLRLQCMEYWSKNSNAGHFTDCAEAIASPLGTTWAPRAGVLRDYVHLSASGAQRIGQLLAASYNRRGVSKSILQPNGAWDEPRYAQSRVRNRNPLLIGGSATTLPTSWNDVALTTSRGVTARADGFGNVISAAHAAIPASAHSSINWYNANVSDIDLTKKYVLVFDWEVSNPSLIHSPNLVISWNAGSTYYTAGVMRPGGFAVDTTLSAFSGTFVSPVMDFTGATGMSIYFGCYASPSGSGAFEQKISRMALVAIDPL